MTKTTVWRPLPDGDYTLERIHTGESTPFTIRTSKFTGARIIRFDSKPSTIELGFPAKYHFCEQVEVDAPTVPDDVIAALKYSIQDLLTHNYEVSAYYADKLQELLNTLTKGGDDAK